MIERNRFGRKHLWAHPRAQHRWVGLLAALLMLASLASCNKNNDDDDDGGPGPSPPPNVVRYTAVGASDAIGVGSTAPCVPFSSCPDGRGYVPVIARTLRGQGRDVTLSNLGIPGAVLSPAIESLSEQHGRDIPANFLQQEMPFVRSGATLITIFAGGNDTNAVATAVDRGAGASNVNAFIDAQVQTFATDYTALVAGVRQRAGSPQIILINLPNFAGLPFTAGRSTTQRRWMQRISVGFSRAANALRASDVRVVDILCEPRAYQRANYSSDGFHPSDAGYAFMAEKVVDAIEGDPGPPPADCSFMRIVQ
jgi:lysophospholipase L1-like esterase